MSILYIISSYNIFSGTPKKTLDLARNFNKKASIYVYNEKHPEFKKKFEETGASVYEGFYGWNFYRHVKKIKKILRDEKITIVQTQFAMGTFLAYLIKRIVDPNIKMVVAFVGGLEPKSYQKFVLRKIYSRSDELVYISEFVKSQKEFQFPGLKLKTSRIIYNGTDRRKVLKDYKVKLKNYSVLAVSGLIKIKNIQILIGAFNILINEYLIKDIFLYVAGDGPYKNELEFLIDKFGLNEHIILLGYQRNIGQLIDDCNLFVHPCYMEGFGIAVSEAMQASKPIIVSDRGALPELIIHEKSGLVIDPFDPVEWAKAILKFKNDLKFSYELGQNAKSRAQNHFALDKFINQYSELYNQLITETK